MSLSHGILGMLSYGSMTGYDLSKAFASSVNYFWSAQTSQIYLELSKLEKQELVTAELVVQTERPNKKLYSITSKGKQTLLHWLAANDSNVSQGTKNAFLMKVFFSGLTTPESSTRMLQQFAADCQAELDRMAEVPASILEYGQEVPPAQTIYWQFTADFGTRNLQMCIDWATACIAQLEALS